MKRGSDQAQDQTRYRFGRWTLDPGRRQLLDGDVPVELQDQTFDLLCYLVRHPGRVIAKDDLLKGAWGHVHLSDSAIAQAVRRVRKALGLQYVSRRWIVEGTIQLPVADDPDGTAPEDDYIVRVGFRYNF